MFNTDEFTRQLMESQIPLGFKRNKLASKASPALHFYQKWLRTPAFAVWLRKRVDASHEASRSRFLGELGELSLEERRAVISQKLINSLDPVYQPP